MEIDKRVFAPITIEGDRRREATQAIKLAKAAAENGADRAELMQFLIDHMELEKNKAEVSKRYENTVYHPNVEFAAVIRCEAYRIMLERMLKIKSQQI